METSQSYRGTLNERINYRQQLKREMLIAGKRNFNTFNQANINIDIHGIYFDLKPVEIMRKPSRFAFTKRYFPQFAEMFPKHAF